MAQTPKTPAAPRKAGPARASRSPVSKSAEALTDAVAKPAPKAPAAKSGTRSASKAKPAPEAQVAAAASALVSAVGESFALRKKDLVDRVVAALVDEGKRPTHHGPSRQATGKDQPTQGTQPHG